MGIGPAAQTGQRTDRQCTADLNSFGQQRKDHQGRQAFKLRNGNHVSGTVDTIGNGQCLPDGHHGQVRKALPVHGRSGWSFQFDHQCAHCQDAPLFRRRRAFMAELVADLERFERYCAKRSVKPACRLNGTSDIQSEVGHSVIRKGKAYPSIFAAFPQNAILRLHQGSQAGLRELPRNYDLTLSHSGANSDYAALIDTAHKATGRNVAVVFRSKALRDSFIASGWNGTRVIDGDRTDMRFADPRGVVVGLYAKGKARSDTSGFVID